ncbi:hypothetical protein K523DRAFT_10640 [Schizophyllum commune Tattone D]|nr:hypothetical protein K523DRAFT_10640 [Schizophyllum commune Tattone D]
MGQSHSRRPEAHTNGSAPSTAADRVDGAPAGRATKEVKKEQAHRLRNASTSSAKPTHTRNKSNATDKESGNKWRKRLSSTFGKHRRSSRIGKELLGSGAHEVDEAGMASGAAETAVDGPPVDENQGAEAERRELAGVEQVASPAAATPTPSTPRRATEDARETRPFTDRGSNVPTSPSSERHSHDDARHDHPNPQSSSLSTSSPPASSTNAVQSSSPSPPNAPPSPSDSATNASNNASDASANNNATPTPTHAPPTGVLLVQGIVQTHNIRVDSEDRSSSPGPASSPESENALSDPEADENSEAPVTASTTAAAQPTATASDAEAAPSAGGERDQAQASNASIQEPGSTSTRRRLSTLFSSLRRSSGERAARAPASREHSAVGSRTSLASVGPEETAAESNASATNAGEEQPPEDVRPSDAAPPPRPARVDPPLPNHTIDVLSTYLS